MPIISSPARMTRGMTQKEMASGAAVGMHLWVDWIFNYTKYDVSTITEDIVDICAASSIHSTASIITNVSCPITNVYGDIIHNTLSLIH